MNDSVINPNNLPPVAVIIVNWNGLSFLPDCLGSLTKTDYPTECWRIILIDNDSSDGSKEWIQKHYPQITIVSNRQNLGFAKANNQGAGWAIEHGFKYVVFLNYDTTVEPAWLKELVAQAESENLIGSVQAKILLFNDKTKINTLGNKLQYLGFGYCGDYLKDEQTAPTQSQQIAYPSGAAMLVKCEVLAKVGLFDEDLFMYHEDLDLGWRIWLAGYRVVNAPRSHVYHKYGFSRNPKKLFYLERNRHLVILKNYSLKTLILLSPAVALMEIGMLGYSLVSGWFIPKLRSYGDIFRELRRTLAKRKNIQSRRLITDREFARHLSTGISFEEFRSPLVRWILNPLLWLYWKIIYLFI
ncbi:MAG: glycosyltransferase family 2 protein [Patescibacteria group bacterium]|nr:glycosyltransferase family 2 protein [Patescibacteria group bacterium]